MKAHQQRSKAIAALGNVMHKDLLPQTQAILADEQNEIATNTPAPKTDIPYGADPRHVLDIYSPTTPIKDAPVLVWIHGGGFLRGNKSSPDNPFNAHMGRFAANNGMIGIVINYRLAPDHPWPSGGQDMAKAVNWVTENIAAYGGSPDKIILGGTSAGAAHCAQYLQFEQDQEKIKACLLLSGLYGYMPYIEHREVSYFGADESLHDARRSKYAVAKTNVPLFIAVSEHDPKSFQTEYTGMISDYLDYHGKLPQTQIVAGHNHYSISYHIGTTDTRFSDEILDFIGKYTS